MKTYVYVDGFNLYYGALRKTPYKWLDIEKLCRLLLPSHEIARIKYFTAVVDSRPWDPDAPTRQQVYLRALRTIPKLGIYFGHFLTHAVWLQDALPPLDPPRYVRVLKTEEKGSDVALATHLVRDGFMRGYECAVIVSNDSDLLPPVKVAKEELGLEVGILCPHKKVSRVLLPPTVSFVKRIRGGPLSQCQFPPRMGDANGEFFKPPTW